MIEADETDGLQHHHEHQWVNDVAPLALWKQLEVVANRNSTKGGLNGWLRWSSMLYLAINMQSPI